MVWGQGWLADSSSSDFEITLHFNHLRGHLHLLYRLRDQVDWLVRVLVNKLMLLRVELLLALLSLQALLLVLQLAHFLFLL